MLFCLRIFPTFVAILGGILVSVASLPTTARAHGALDEKIAQLSQALEAAPDDAALRFQLAATQTEHGDWADALIQLRRVDELAPGAYRTALVRGEACLTGRLFDRARGALDQALFEQPGHARAHLLRARVAAAEGDVPSTLADYRAALRGQPALVAEFRLEAAEALAKHGQASEAAEVLVTAVAECGASPALVEPLLTLEILLARYDAALGRISVLQAAAPVPEHWMARRAEILAAAGRPAEAQAAWAALRTHLATLPTLQRGLPHLREIAMRAERALAVAGTGLTASPP